MTASTDDERGYYLDLFSPATYEAFSDSDRTISGFRPRHLNAASRIHPGDRLICYMTKLSRWIGVLQVESDSFKDDAPIFYEANDPFVIRFKVSPVVWLPVEKCVPIHEPHVWNTLSFTKEHEPGSIKWTGKIRTSLVQLDLDDSLFLEDLLIRQAQNGVEYPFDREQYEKLVARQVRRHDGAVTVTVPEGDEEEDTNQVTVRESIEIQALLARIGEAMNFRVWLPKRDRSEVLQEWKPREGTLLERLPLNYDETTLKTIEQIDVLWLKGRSISRAFEVEHTTAVYSGILRMADLLALQPNMDISLHIVAPIERRDKVLDEIKRPVFSLLERRPLSECCTYMSYDSLRELAQNKYLHHLSDAVLEEYAEEAE